MNGHIEQHIGNALARWAGLMARYAIWVVLFFLLSAGGSLYYAIHHLGINTDNSEMLDESLPYRQTLKIYKEAFPQQTNLLLLVIDGPDPESTYDATKQLSERLNQRTDDFHSVHWPAGGDYFEDQALYYLSTDELSDMADRLDDGSPLLTQLQGHPTAQRLLGILQGALANSSDDALDEIGNLLEGTTESLAAYAQGNPEALDWQKQLFTTESETGSKRHLLLVQPKLDFSNLFAAGAAIRDIRAEASETGIGEGQAIQLRITGSAALAYEELKSVSQGMGTAALISLLLVIVLLWIGTGSLRILLYSILSLLVGLCLTAGFAAISIGSLNLISVAFAVLYIGLGIDFAIHLSLRYSEFRDNRIDNVTALRSASKDVGSALVICTLSTAIGFYAFIPTAFVGVSELGLISGTGMFISLVVSLSLLPALFALSPVRMSRRLHNKMLHTPGPVASFLKRHDKRIMVGFLVLGLISSFAIIHTRFDYDVLNLRDQTSESVSTYRDLLNTSDTPPWRLTVLADSAQQAALYREELEALPSVDKVIDIHDLLPSEPEEKQELVADMQELLEEIQDVTAVTEHSTLEKLNSILQKLEAQQTSNPDISARILDLHAALLSATDVLESLPEERRTEELGTLDQLLVGGLAPALEDMQLRLNHAPAELDTLPRTLRDRWISNTGTWRMLVFAKNDLSDVDMLRTFVNEVSAQVPQVTDLPAISLASGEAAVQAFQQAFITALILISLLLWILLRNPLDTLLVLIPLLLAGMLTTAAGVLLGIPFNFANIITLPLLLGIGVDNGIHMVSRARTAMPDNGDLLHTTTSRAVILSALTTVASFGNLAFSNHPGTASMGQLLTIGVLLTMICTLLVLPSLLRWRSSAIKVI